MQHVTFTRSACRVLIVEDNPDGRDALRKLLKVLGHQVEVAQDGIEGVTKGLELNPDVVLIDIDLPFLNGLEVARRLRAGLGATVVLIAHTAHGSPDSVRRGYEAGFDAYLVKPMELDDLVPWLVRRSGEPIRERGE
jgi:CheY-like chemotaxis protein